MESVDREGSLECVGKLKNMKFKSIGMTDVQCVYWSNIAIFIGGI